MIALWVHGPFRAAVDGVELSIASRRGRALLAYCGVEGRPVPRERLAEVLWGPRRLNNLRQELYQLRRLAGAAEWLQDDAEHVSVRAEVRSDPSHGPFLDGLDGVGAALFSEWLDAQRAGGGAGDLEERLMRVLAHAPELNVDEVAAVLGAPSAALAEVWDRLARGTDMVGGALRPGLAAAIRRGTAPQAAALLHVAIAEHAPRVAAEHFEAAGAVAHAARAWFDRGRANGDLAAMRRGAALASETADRAAMLEGLVAACRRLGDPAAAEHAAVLGQLARDSQHPAAVAADAFVAVTLCLDRGDVAAAERAARELRHAVTDADGQAKAAVADAAIALRVGRFADAVAGLSAVSPVGRGARVLVDNALGAARAYLGDVDGADRHHRAALREARADGDRIGAITLLNALAANDDRRGDLEGAFERVDEAVGLLDGSPTPLLLGLHHNRAALALQSGRLGVLRDSANKLLDAARRLDAPAAVARAMHHRGALELEISRDAEAALWFERAVDAHPPSDVVWAAIHAFNVVLVGGSDPWPALDRLRDVGRAEVWRDALLDVAVRGRVAADVRRALALAEPLGGGPAADARRAFAAWRLGGAAPVATVTGRDGWRLAVAARQPAAAEAWLTQASLGLLPAQAEALQDHVRRALADPSRWLV